MPDAILRCGITVGVETAVSCLHEGRQSFVLLLTCSPGPSLFPYDSLNDALMSRIPHNDVFFGCPLPRHAVTFTSSFPDLLFYRRWPEDLPVTQIPPSPFFELRLTARPPFPTFLFIASYCFLRQRTLLNAVPSSFHDRASLLSLSQPAPKPSAPSPLLMRCSFSLTPLLSIFFRL